MVQESIVIVLDTSNYKTSHSEDVPFKAKVLSKTEHELWVKSLTTGNEYELYRPQILECFDIDTIKKMLDLRAYGGV